MTDSVYVYNKRACCGQAADDLLAFDGSTRFERAQRTDEDGAAQSLASSHLPAGNSTALSIDVRRAFARLGSELLWDGR